MSERERQVERLAQQARELPQEERSVWLAEQCAGDEVLRSEVESHIASQEAGPPDTELMDAGTAIDLQPGSRLSHYEILEPLGKGAMGEVWLARDEVLNRQVAIKLPSKALMGDPTTRRRLLREAQAAAALKHPSVCQVYEVGQEEGQDFIVMEHVEGQTLEARLRGGSISVKQRLEWAASIAAAVEEAHEHGIVHRDLKPPNVMVTPRDGVKVMDFGLARRLPSRGKAEKAGGPGSAELTSPGLIVGTPRYMAPEQIKGEAITEAADIWAFGCILYQMFSGRPAFEGSSSTETLGAVLEREVNLDQLPARVPMEVRLLVERCLRKDPHARLQHIGDARLILEDAISIGDQLAPESAAASSGQARWLRTAAVAGAALLAGGLIGFLVLGPPVAGPAGESPVRFTLATETFNWGGPLEDNLAVHPDGTGWVFRARDGEGDRLWLRTLERDEARPIPGTEGGGNPFWSPDGRYLGFVAEGTIRRVEPFVGSARTVVKVASGGIAGTPSWGEDGTILFGDYLSKTPGIYRVSAEGGETALVLEIQQVKDARILAWPTHIPGSDRFLVFGGAEKGRYQLYLAGPEGDPIIPIPEVRSRGEVLEPGLLIYERAGALLVQSFNADAGKLTGDPVSIVGSVVRNPPTGAVAFSASPGLLVSGNRVEWSRVQWFDRSGTPLERVGEEGDISQAVLSPDGTRVLLSAAETPGDVEDLWIYDLTRDVANPLTSTPWIEYLGVWSPDGTRIAHASDAFGPPDVRVRDAHRGSEPRTLVGGGSATYPFDWSPDGESVLYVTFANGDLWVAPVDGSRPQPWLRAKGMQSHAQFSPDGRWVAFRSTELGSPEIFVAPVDDADQRRRVSVDEGHYPAWGSSGDQLYFASHRAVFAVGIDRESGRPVGRAQQLFQVASGDRIRGLDVDEANQRFLLVILDEEQLEPRITVQFGWQTALNDGDTR